MRAISLILAWVIVALSPAVNNVRFQTEAVGVTWVFKLMHSVDALENGSIVTFERARVRVRLLPIGPPSGNEST